MFQAAESISGTALTLFHTFIRDIAVRVNRTFGRDCTPDDVQTVDICCEYCGPTFHFHTLSGLSFGRINLDRRLQLAERQLPCLFRTKHRSTFTKFSGCKGVTFKGQRFTDVVTHVFQDKPGLVSFSEDAAPGSAENG